MVNFLTAKNMAAAYHFGYLMYIIIMLGTNVRQMSDRRQARLFSSDLPNIQINFW